MYALYVASGEGSWVEMHLVVYILCICTLIIIRVVGIGHAYMLVA